MVSSESLVPMSKSCSQRSRSPLQISFTAEATQSLFSITNSGHRSSPIPRIASPVEPRKYERPESPVPSLKQDLKVSAQSPRRKSPEPVSPQKSASEISIDVMEDRRPLAGHKHNLFDDSDSDSSVSSQLDSEVDGSRRAGAHLAVFKDKSSSRKGRHYRDRADSRSPDVCVSSSTGDVDLRQCGPPQKLARLTTFQPDVALLPVTTVLQDDVKSPSIEVAAKDVDLRQIPGTPGKKRPSLDGSDQPQVKKSKAEMLDVLFGFGGEDVDLRQLPTTTVQRQTSPPPAVEDTSIDRLDNDDHDKDEESSIKDEAANTKGWAKYKELKPDAFKSPRPFGGLNRDVRDKNKLNTSLTYESQSPHSPVQSPMYDKLGRRLLYKDQKRRTSFSSELSPLLSETDTDMRQPSILARDTLDSMDRSFNFDLIVAQADEQLKSGTLSSTEYNKLLQQMIQLNETHKLREAQRRDEQEKQSWEEKRRRKKKRVDSSNKDLDNTSPVSSPESFNENTEDKNISPGFVSQPNTRFGDIDERFPPAARPRLPSTASTGPGPGPSVVHPTGALQSLWGDVSSAAPSGQHAPPLWELPPHHPATATATSPWRPATTVPHVQPPPPPPPPHIAPPLHLLPPAPPAGYHRPPGPAPAGPAPGPYGVRWRNPYPGRHFDADSDSRFDRFGSRGRFPRLSLHGQLMQRPPPGLSLGPLVGREQELPPADPMILDLIAQDSMRTIAIDSVPRNIRFYGDTAVVILEWNNPREISFQAGTRRVTFDDRESFVCSFNSPYRDIILDGNKHRIRLGAPTREFYVDGKWYECFFGGPPVKMELNGKLWSVKLDGPSPQVRIGVSRLDLVAGKVSLIIDACAIVPIFLDAKPQRFDIEGIPHILRFADALRTVLINGQPLDVEFGGLPKPVIVGGKKHFLRLSMLPEGIVPGYAKIVSMEGSCLPSPPHVVDEDSNSLGFPDESSNDNTLAYNKGHEPVLPRVYRNLSGDSRGRHGLRRRHDKERGGSNSPSHFLTDRDVTSASIPRSHHHHNQPPRNRPAGQLPLELLTSLMPGTLSAPASACSYQIEQESSQDSLHKPKEDSDTPAGGTEVSTATAASSKITAGVPLLPVDINVEELFKKLVATGIVTSVTTQPDNVSTETKKEDAGSIKDIDLKQPDMLKTRQPALITMLYSGIQCSSCGVRFSPEQTMKYSQHLDWHFRQNRRDRDNTRKALSRKWYYDVSDWIQFEEIEDLEERAQSWFEVMQTSEGRPDDKEEQEVPSVSAGESLEDTFCDVCHDKFEQFYNEEREEWHLRLAVRIDGKTYHPICYDDYKASLEKTVDDTSTTEDAKEEAVAEKPAEENEEKETRMVEKEAEVMEEEDDDEDVVLVEPPEAKEIIEIDDTIDEKEENAESNKNITEQEEANLKEDESTVLETGETANPEDAVIERLVTIKLEPLDDDDDDDDDDDVEVTENQDVKGAADAGAVVHGEEEAKPAAPVADTTHVSVACSIDGNVQFEDQTQVATTVPGKIKINITKPAVSKDMPIEAEENQTNDDDKEEVSSAAEPTSEATEASLCAEQTEMTEPPPPGVGPEPVHMKSLLVGRKLTEMPKVQKGNELSALCSIM